MLRDLPPLSDIIIGSIASATRDWPVTPLTCLIVLLACRTREPEPLVPCPGHDDDYDAQERIRRLMPPI